MTTTNDLLENIKHELPENWSNMEPELQLHHLLLAADEVLQPSGDFILLNKNITVAELLEQGEQQPTTQTVPNLPVPD